MLATLSPQDILKKVQEFLPARLKLLSELVEQNSFTENAAGVNAVQSRLEDAFWELGMRTEHYPCAKRGYILTAVTMPSAKNPILLVGHADTVHKESADFKSLITQGDTLRGPGVYDMKSGLIQILTILDVLKSLNCLGQIPIKVIVNSAEENSTKETIEKICELSRGASAALVFELGRDNDGLVVERKGIAELWLTAKGKEAHSGNNFYQGTNAILPLIEVAKYAAGFTNEDKGITVNIARFDGGTQLCVIPGAAKLGIEVRGGTVESINETLNAIEKKASEYPEVTFHVDTKTAPLNKLPGTDALLADILEAGKKVGLQFSILPRVGGLSDANLIGSQGVPTIDALGPTGGGAHTREEFVNGASIAPRVAAVVTFLLHRA